MLFAQERFRRAAETYEARLKLDDRSPLVRYKLALARYREGAIDVGLEEARRAMTLDPQLSDAHYLAALCLRDQGHLEDAAVELQQALRQVPTLLPAREELAAVFHALQRPAEELEQLQLLATLDRGRIERQIAIADVQVRLGEPDLAVATLAAALPRAADPSTLQAALGRVWLNVAQADPAHPDALSKALEALERAASSLTATSETKALYGRALAFSGQLDAAEQLFSQAIERYPLEPSALRDLGLVAERLGHAEKARSALIQYASLVPDDEAAQQAVRIGALSLTLDDAQGALPWLQRALASTPDDVETLALLADAQFRTGDLAGARASIVRVLTLDPSNRDAKALKTKIDRRLSTN